MMQAIHRKIIAMDGRDKFDKYTELWRDVERAREAIYFAQKDCELIAHLRDRGQQGLEQAILELCAMRCPKCGRKLEETVSARPHRPLHRLWRGVARPGRVGGLGARGAHELAG
jgi:hypothetical protein